MEFQGTLIKKLEERTGTSARGNWHRQDVIFEMMDGAYARKVAVTFFNKPDEVKSLVEGAKYDVSFNIESREYNERWYTDVRAWRITPAVAAEAAAPQAAPAPSYAAAPAAAPTAAPAASAADDVDDLPF
ncbi:MAG: DUF3127 domain-containing protein [Rikenellaceae bacterium]